MCLRLASWAKDPDISNVKEVSDLSVHAQVVAALLFYSTLDKCLVI
jgi:hypothetical protein